MQFRCSSLPRAIWWVKQTANLPPGVLINNQQEEQIGIVMSEAMNALRPRLEELMISASAETFKAILDGEENPTAAFMTGKLSVDGDMGAAMKLGTLLS